MAKAKTAITPTREENYSEWYSQVIVNADLAENSPVRGCMTIKPYGFAIWELLRDSFDKIIKTHGVQNAYFPLLIPLSFMTKEAEHVDGFAKECAVVTHYRLTDNSSGEIVPDPTAKLGEAYIIRPTSETIIGEAYSRWINSYRDLPLKINQWANVMRWEMRTKMFLRTSEFLWQEGHNAFATKEEAIEDAEKMLNVYHDFAKNTLAIYSLKGVKTPEERFPGADNTYTFEGMMQDGKALQMGTAHDLGQHFSKSFNIKFANKEGVEEYAYTTSWGVTTRLMGGVIMAHSDDDGLVLPPTIAPYQVVIIPFIRDEEDREAIETKCKEIQNTLIEKDIRVMFDNSDEKPVNKIWKWIKKGAPIRIEVGKRDLENNSVMLKRRDKNDKESAINCKLDKNSIATESSKLIKTIQENMLNVSIDRTNAKTTEVSSIEEMEKLYAENFEGFVKMPLDITETKDFDVIAGKYKLTRRCIPFNEPNKVFIAKSY